MKKRKGNLEITVSMYLIVFTVVIVAYLMQMLEFMAVSRYAEVPWRCPILPLQ